MSTPVVLPTSIAAVEVFRAAALVTRRGSARPGSEGDLTLRLPGLPRSLTDSSLRARVVTGAGRVLDLHVAWDLTPRTRALRTGLEDRLRSLERRRLELEVERARALARGNLAARLAPTPVAQTELPDGLAFRPARPATAAIALGRFIGEEVRAASEQGRAIEAELQQLADALEAARSDLARESAAAREALALLHKAAVVRVGGVSASAELVLELTYLLPRARWAPEYELRVADGRDEAELAVRALVAQRSGEDWPALSLAFSTADLARSAELPRLDSWRVGRAQPLRATGWREPPSGLEELFAGYDASWVAPSGARAPRAAELPAMPSPITEEARAGAADAGADERPPRRGAAHRKAMPPPAPPSFTPPPSPPTAPAPAMAAAPTAMAERSRRVMARAPAALASVAATMMFDEEASSPALAGEPAGPEPAPALVASGRALDYGALRLAPADDHGRRGQLEAVGPTDDLRDALAALAPESARGLDRSTLEAALTSDGGSLSFDLPEHARPLEESAGSFAARYQADSPTPVAADGLLHGVTVLRRRGEVRRVLACVPARDPSVYEVVTFNNPLDVPLLAGPVRVFRGSDFVVTAPLETTAPGGTLTVGLGVEPGVAVARNTFFEEAPAGLLGGGAVLRHRVELEVRSKLARSVRVELYERVPVSHDDDVKVEVVKTEPKAERYDQAARGEPIEGGLRFVLDLEPRGVRTCVLAYNITLPQKHVLVGGNRRD